MGNVNRTVTIDTTNGKPQELCLPHFYRLEAVLGRETRDDRISVPVAMKIKDITIDWEVSMYSTESQQISTSVSELLLYSPSTINQQLELVKQPCTIFALKKVPSRNRDKMGHLHGGTELRKCEVQCQGGKLFTAWDSIKGSARGRMSTPVSALLAGQISKMLAKRKQCHPEDEWTVSPAAAEAWLRCLAWHQTSVFLRRGTPHLTHPVWRHGCSYNTISFGQFSRGGRRMEISYRLPQKTM